VPNRGGKEWVQEKENKRKKRRRCKKERQKTG
jgi:hypothetical protein